MTTVQVPNHPKGLFGVQYRAKRSYSDTISLFSRLYPAYVKYSEIRSLFFEKYDIAPPLHLKCNVGVIFLDVGEYIKNSNTSYVVMDGDSEFSVIPSSQAMEDYCSVLLLTYNDEKPGEADMDASLVSMRELLLLLHSGDISIISG